MSLLWPETVTLGIFPDACWLRRGARGEVITQQTQMPAGDVMGDVAALLDQLGPSVKRRTRVRVILSDSLAALALLPWQSSLASSAQLRAYARMVLEAGGAIQGDQWVVEACFRHFGKPGLALAVQRDWIEQLLALLAERGLRLADVQPLSVVAYQQLPAGHGRALVLLRESGRLTGLVYDRRRLLAIDVQPVYDAVEQDMARFCRRQQALHGDVAEASIWSTVDADAVAAVFSRYQSKTPVVVVPPQKWGARR